MCHRVVCVLGESLERASERTNEIIIYPPIPPNQNNNKPPVVVADRECEGVLCSVWTSESADRHVSYYILFYFVSATATEMQQPTTTTTKKKKNKCFSC